MPRKPTHHFGLGLVMTLIAFFPFRLNPDGFTSIDIVAVVFFGLLAAIFVVLGILGILRMRRDGSTQP
jgi:hypothetical protein